MYTFSEIDEASFDAFEQAHPQGTFVQSVAQKHVLEQRGTKVALVGVRDAANTVVAAAMVTWAPLKFGQLFTVDRGPLLDFEDTVVFNTFVTGLKAFAKARGGLYLKFFPNVVYQNFDDHGEAISEPNEAFVARMQGAGFIHEQFASGFTTAATPQWQYVKDLRAVDPTKVSAAYTKDATYYLKKNAQFGTKVRELTYADLSAFKTLTQTTADRLHYHDKDLDFYEKTFAAYGDNAHFLFAEISFSEYIAEEQHKVAELDVKLTNIQDRINRYPDNKKFPRQFAEFDDQKQHHLARIEKAAQQAAAAGQDVVVVAGALFIKQPQEMTYLYSGTYEEYMDFYGPYQIQDKMITEAVQAGIPQFNFFGISGTFDGSDGVLRFKTSFNGHAQQLVGAFELPVNPLKYKVYRALKKLLGRS